MGFPTIGPGSIVWCKSVKLYGKADRKTSVTFNAPKGSDYLVILLGKDTGKTAPQDLPIEALARGANAYPGDDLEAFITWAKGRDTMTRAEVLGALGENFHVDIDE